MQPRRRAREVDVLPVLLLLASLIPGAAWAAAPETQTPAAAADSAAVIPAPETGAGPAAPADLRVGVIRVTGNAFTDSLRIVRTFDVPPGSRFAEDAVRRGLRKLFALGLFSDVSVDQEPRGDRIDLVIHVRERPRIAQIEFTGNKKRQTSDLEKKATLRVGEVYSPVVVQTQVDSLLRYYRDDGFARATVEASTDTLAAGGVRVRFAIQEGAKVRITGVEFAGAQAFPAKTLKKHLKTRAKGFFGGGEVKDEEAAEDQEKLEAFYRSRGHRDMRVTGREVTTTSDPRKLTLVVSVDEGRPYVMGKVSWSGTRVVPASDLDPLWKGKPLERYDISKIERVQGLAYSAYAEQGYLYVGIEPHETVRDSNVVDLDYRVTEGQPSRVRFVNITGNRGTREKVIRREIDLHEGERFRRSALMRTQGDLSRLGLFEEVIPDFSPADSTDVDINIKVKEKQVGTASAGAGYTGEMGLTGFVELGHNNVLGNGQSLSLHLERGNRRSDYFLSFTEPWFRDTPTLLGFSAFNSMTDRDLYKEKRRGGSVRIGRPLPWPDYSRGSIGYSLEDVTISQYAASPTLQDQVVLAGISTGHPVRTSSLNLDFNRNSQDNAFYPTRGTRLILSSEFAGGPFLGAVNYIKNRMEGRIYLPSVHKRLTTMLRARFGVLGIWAGQHAGVPPYERFRLGGGSVADPLRGYDDYQIVPEKFIRDFREIGTIDNSKTPPDTTYRATRVRYPGGRYMAIYTVEQQFPVVHPLHGVLFFDAGDTWDQWKEIRPFKLKMGAGIGFRMEIPLLGNIGFDYGYGFNRDDGPRARGHFLLGNINF